jgi:uncharacterized protein YaiL (DUF2058 family)
MPNACNPENIIKLDSTKKISINELQKQYQKNGRLPAVHFFVALAGSRYSIVVLQRHMVTLQQRESLILVVGSNPCAKV